MHIVAYATQEGGRELCQSCSCSVDFPRGGSNITDTVKVTRSWKSSEVSPLRVMAKTFGLDACIKWESESSCGCSKIPRLWSILVTGNVHWSKKSYSIWRSVSIHAYGCLDWSKQVSFTPLGKKKECNQLIAGKVISMQIDFSAAKTSAERY